MMRGPVRAVVMAVVGVTACTSASTSQSDAGQTYVGCVGDTRINTRAWPADIASDDGALVLHIAAATPTVPLAGENTWTVAFQTPNGGQADVADVKAAAFMPDHGHPSSVTPTLTQQPDGTWRVEQIYLTMAGVWRVTFTVQLKSGATKTVLAFACVAG